MQHKLQGFKYLFIFSLQFIFIKEEARKRRIDGNKLGADITNHSLEKIPTSVEPFHSSKEAGKLFNVSEKYVREAKKLKETPPEQFKSFTLKDMIKSYCSI